MIPTRGAMPSNEESQVERMMLICFGHIAFEAVWAGVELELFELLSRTEGATRRQVEEDLSLQEQPAEVLLGALTALGVIDLDGERYRNTRFAQTSLTRHGASSLVDVLAWQHHIVYPAISSLAPSLRQNVAVGLDHFKGPGRTLYERLQNHPDLEAIFQRAMAAMPSNRLIAEALDVGSSRHLVDVGGGNARNAITLARAHPGLKVTVFDAPSVCEHARRNIVESGLGSQVDTHPGDFFRDAYPPDVDGVLFSHICPIWSRKANRGLFARARDAIGSGGRIFVFNMVSDSSGRGPLVPALGSCYFHAVATGEGMVYSAETYQTLLREVGFRDVTIRRLPIDHAVVVGVK